MSHRRFLRLNLIMKNLLAVSVTIATLIGFIPTGSRAQGSVLSATSITTNQFAMYMTLASVVGVVNTGGLVGFYQSPMQSYEGPSALSTAVSFLNENGMAGISVTILNGQFGSIGGTASDSLSQPRPLSGFVIALYNPSQPVGSASGLSGLNINGSLQPGPTTVSQSFSAYYYGLQDPTLSLNVNAELDTTLGSGTTLWFVPVYSTIPEPSISSQPLSRSVTIGSNVTFSVTAYGAAQLNYQWFFGGQRVAGQMGTTFSITNAQFANAGNYFVIVTNSYGSVTSAVARLTVYTNLVVARTNRTPPARGAATITTDTNHFRVYIVGGEGIDTNRNTVVITHGWNDSSTNWPETLASEIGVSTSGMSIGQPNIILWDWTAEAANPKLAIPANNTLGQGYALGNDLIAALGANYSKRVHFIGHSLGTMVNAKAANYIEGHGWSWTNIQMTLFDEASVASGLMVDSWQTALTLLQNDSNPQLSLLPVLPAQFAWADNYITAFGLLHPQAVNVILTNYYPVIQNGLIDDIQNAIWQGFVTADTRYHSYPYIWYLGSANQTSDQNAPPYPMGFFRSWEGGGASGRLAANSFYIQATNCPASYPTYGDYNPDYNVVQISPDQAGQFLNARLKNILPQHLVAAVSTSDQLLSNNPNQVNAAVAAGSLLFPPAAAAYPLALLVRFGTTLLVGTPLSNGQVHPLDGPVPKIDGTNLPAYVWITLSVPTNALSMSFDFLLEGDGQQDSFQAALNNTNIFTLETLLIQTNTPINSGLIDISQYAGQTVELFLGIVGGTSTNATATVGNITFYTAAPPALQIQMTGTNVALSWPLWAANYVLEKTDTLSPTNRWTVVTNTPAVVNSAVTVTNKVGSRSQFYRLQ